MGIGNLVAFADPSRARTNIAAWNLINQVNGLNRELTLRQLRIATGKQQPRMEDGASFFAIWNKMKNQVRGKAMAIDNIGDAKDELSMAEAGLLQIDDMLGKMRDLAVRAANDTLTDEQRQDIRQEILNLYIVISNVVKRTNFNEGGAGADSLLDGFSHTYQVGPNETALDRFTVEISNILLGITRAFSPELAEKLDVLGKVFSTLPTEARASIAAEVRDYAKTVPEGGLRKIINALADSFEQPNGFEVHFLTELAKSGLDDIDALDQHLETLFETRLNTAIQDPSLKDFHTDAEVGQAIQGLTPFIADLAGNSSALTTLADSFQNIAETSEIAHEGLVDALNGLSGAIREVRDRLPNAIDGLADEINTDLNSPTQRLFVAQDLVFFASADPSVANRPAVQNALNQLALDIANGLEDLPSFREAVAQISDADQAALQAALRNVATDNQNGLSFHVAVPDLDGPGGPFALEPNSFAGFIISIAEQLPDPEDTNDGNLAVVLQRVASALDIQYPRVAGRLNTIVALLADNNDANDADLAAAFSALGDQIEDDTGTSSFFTNPIARSAVSNAFTAQFNTQAFANLSPALQNAYWAFTDNIVGVLDINGPGAPLSQAPNTLASLAVGITETNPVPVPPEAELDDLNMAGLLQSAAGAMAPAFPDIASSMSAVAGLLADQNDGNDNLLAGALATLGAQIEAVSGGQNEVDGAIRAELRRVLLEQTATDAFNNLSFPGKAAYLTLAETLGAYTAEQIAGLDAQLDAVADALSIDATGLYQQLTGLAEQLTDETVSGADREAVIAGLARTATFLDEDDEEVLALRNVLDDPNNNHETNPLDLVGILARHIPDAQNQALQTLMANPVDRDWGNAIEDFLILQDSADAQALLTGVDEAIDFVKDELINLGGTQTKLTSLQDLMSTSQIAEDSVASRFGDADLAKEQVEIAKLQLFSQLATAQTAAANMLPSQLIAGLLGG